MIIFKSNVDTTILAKSKWGAINIKLIKNEKYFCTTNFYALLLFALESNNIKHGVNQIQIEKENGYKYIDITQKLSRINKYHINDIVNKKKEIKILIINGFVSGIGDNLVGLSALKIFHEEYKNKFDNITFDCYNENILRIYNTLAKYKLFNQYLSFPQKLETLKTYDCILDLDNVHEWTEFNNLPMIDCFLSIMGIDYKNIEPYRKKNTVTIDYNTYKNLNPIFKGIKYNNDSKLLLLQYDSSAKIRMISNDYIVGIIDKILSNSDYRIIILGDLKYEHTRLLKLKKYSQTLDDFIYIISESDCAITTDTSAYHISDALNKPTVTLFTSIKPELRVKYYTNVKGILLSDPNHPIMGKFDSANQVDLDYVNNLWENLDIQMVLNNLQNINQDLFGHSV